MARWYSGLPAAVTKHNDLERLAKRELGHLINRSDTKITARASKSAEVTTPRTRFDELAG
jgi:uncharacterized protein (DUF1786 family)